MTEGFVSYSIKVPIRKQNEALRDIEFRFRKAVREIREEAEAVIKWAEQNGKEATRHERIRFLCDDALEFQRARKRQAKAQYAKERGTGLERWDE